MPDFPYIQTTGRMKDFFTKIPSVAAPDRVTINWLSSVGFKSKNDRPMIGVLEFIGFTASKKPTDRWTAFRDNSQSARVMAEGIIQGYADLFGTFPDAYNRNEKDLRNFFTTMTPSAGEQVIRKTVNTFRALCTLADFSQIGADDNSKIQKVAKPRVKSKTTKNSASSKMPESGQALVAASQPIATPSPSPSLHIDIQIHISSDADAAQIDQIFKSMATHIYQRDSDKPQ